MSSQHGVEAPRETRCSSVKRTLVHVADRPEGGIARRATEVAFRLLPVVQLLPGEAGGRPFRFMCRTEPTVGFRRGQQPTVSKLFSQFDRVRSAIMPWSRAA